MEASSRPAEISEDNWSLLARLFRSPNEIDLYTAGLAESRAEGERAARETARRKERKNERNAFLRTTIVNGLRGRRSLIEAVSSESFELTGTPLSRSPGGCPINTSLPGSPTRAFRDGPIVGLPGVTQNMGRPELEFFQNWGLPICLS